MTASYTFRIPFRPSQMQKKNGLFDMALFGPLTEHAHSDIQAHYDASR